MIFSLAFLTLQDCGPLEAIKAAAAAGYHRIGLRMLPATSREADYPLLTDNKLLADVLAALEDSGMQVGDVELVRLGPQTRIANYEPFLTRAAQLSARHVIVVNDDTDSGRFTDNFGALCALALPFGLTVDLEPMPWTATTSIQQAYNCISKLEQPNAGLLIDALHFHRCRDSLDAFHSIPDRLLHLFQICDAPLQFDASHEAMQYLSRSARLLPGYGELDILPLLTRLPTNTTISVEVPNQKFALAHTPVERASRSLEATKRMFRRLGALE